MAPIRKRKRKKDVSAGVHPATTPINNTTTTTTTIITAAADMLRTGQMSRIASGISGAGSKKKTSTRVNPEHKGRMRILRNSRAIVLL